MAIRDSDGSWGGFHQGPNQIGWVDCGVRPFLTGVVLQSANFATNNGQVAVNFPYPARWCQVINSGSTTVRVHPASIAAGNVIGGEHFEELPSGSSTDYKVPLGTLYVSLLNSSANGYVRIKAELMPITTGSLPTLTGSGLTE